MKRYVDQGKDEFCALKKGVEKVFYFFFNFSFDKGRNNI